MSLAFLAVGLVLVIEGLALALAPSRFEDLLRVFVQLPLETRRMLGLGAVAIGAVLLWAARIGGAI